MLLELLVGELAEHGHKYVRALADHAIGEAVAGEVTATDGDDVGRLAIAKRSKPSCIFCPIRDNSPPPMKRQPFFKRRQPPNSAMHYYETYSTNSHGNNPALAYI